MKNKVAIAISTALMSVATLQASADMGGAVYSADSLKAVKAISINKGQVFNRYNSKKFVIEKNLGNEQYTYIIRLQNQPIATYNGNIQGLAATNPQIAKKALFNSLAHSKKSSQQIRKELRLDLKSAEAIAYGKFLENKQQKFLSKANAKLGSDLNVVYQYKNAFNGMAVKLTQAQAGTLSSFADVAYIERERIEHIETDTSPILIGATNTWIGEGQSATNMGEGVIIGIVDTGINSDHPSFADIGADGYDHSNPWGTGVYVGDCAGDYADKCNDKLIGIRHYSEITDDYSDTAVFGDTPPPATGEDYNGHGSHTASTAGGNILRDVPMLDTEVGVEEGDGVNSTGFKFSQISGVAPHANIVAYQICSSGDTGDTYVGCSGAAIIAALEDAVADGIDVINYSISGGGDPWISSSEMSFLAAQEAGIFASVSAGNSGPDASTSEKSAPWYTVVGAATHGREVAFEKEIGAFTGGDSELAAIQGKSASGAITASIVWAGNFANSNDPDGDPAQCLQPFPDGTFNGQIVVCDRGAIARVQKAINVRDGGASGYVLANIDGGAPSINNDVYVVPGIHISSDNGNALRAWLASGEGHSATITAAQGEIKIGQADDTAGFSSRGPNSFVADVMTPSVTAPGVSIYAAYADQNFGHDVTGPAPADFAFLQGTSMSSPHVAGAGAVLKSSHPTWTPDNIRSALMLTATTNVRKEDGETAADFFDMGAGRIRVDLADKTGLIMNETAANYTAANPATGGSPRDLNIPSVSDANCVGLCSWTRTITATEAGSWTALSSSLSDGLVIDVTPASFDLAAGESKEITINVDAIGAQSNSWSFGEVVLTSADFPTAQIPVSVIASNGNIPDSFALNAYRNVDSYVFKDMMAIEISDFTARSYGLTKASQTKTTLALDSNNSAVYDDLSDGINVTFVAVPENAKRFVAEVLSSAAPDLDMFVGIDTNGDGIPQEEEEIAHSATASALEKVDINLPAAGNYWIIIQNWAASAEGAEDEFTLATAVVDNELNENLSIIADAAIPALTPFDLSVNWNIDANSGDVFYGAIDLGTSSETAGNLGLISIDLVRKADDVSIGNDISERLFIGDSVNYAVTVNANFMPDDRIYSIIATIPAGMDLDTTSVTGDASIDGNKITWTVDRPSLLGSAQSYDMRTNVEDASCALPDFGQGGGYINFADFGILPGDLNGDKQTAAYGQPVSFMGTLYSSFNVTDDGFIYFTGAHGDSPWENQLLPDPTAANNLVAPLWRDQQAVSSETSGVTVATAGSGWTFVEFDKMRHWLGFADNAAAVGLAAPVGDIADFEVAFNNTTGDFMFAYDNVTHDSGDSLGATVGYEDTVGKTGRADIYAKSVWGGADGAVDSVTTIESGLIMCYTLIPVPDDALVLNFSTKVAKDYKGGNLAVNLSNSVNGLATVEAISSADVDVEGAPIAAINVPIFATEGTSVTFNGSISTDPNGDELTYTWVQLGGTPISFSANAATFTFAAPQVTSKNSVISFHLTVNDGHGNTSTAVASVDIINKKTSGGSFGWLILLASPLLWLRRRVTKE